MVPSQKAEKFRSRTDAEAISNLRVATFSSPEVKGVVQNLLPLMGTFAVTSFVARPLYGQMGPKLIVSLGAAFLAAGIYMLSMIDPMTTYDDLMAGMAVLGIGVGLLVSYGCRSDGAGSVSLQPCRRDYLYVSDRRWIARPPA